MQLYNHPFITYHLPHSQHSREQQAAEGQQQTQCPGHIVTPLRDWSESSPFQSVGDVMTTAVAGPRCLVMPALVPFSLRIFLLLNCLTSFPCTRQKSLPGSIKAAAFTQNVRLISLRCSMDTVALSNQQEILKGSSRIVLKRLPSHDHICLDYRFDICVFTHYCSRRWKNIHALQHKTRGQKGIQTMIQRERKSEDWCLW